MNERAHLTRLLITAAFLLAVAAPLAADITGFVQGPDGAPVAGARIAAYALESSDARVERLVSTAPARKPLAEAKSDDAGAFTIATAVTSGYELETDADGFAPALDRPASTSGVLISLRRALPTECSVTASGEPVAGALVVLHDGERDFIARSNEKGRFTAPDPRAWAYGAIVLHPAHAPLQLRGDGRITTSLELQPGIEVRGKVSGSAAAGARIFVDGLPAGTAGDDGRFAIPRVPRTWRRIEARTAGYIAAVTTRAGELALALRPAATLRGTLREERGNAAVAGARVLLRRMDDGEPTVAISDAKGSYRFDALLPDRYGYDIEAPAHVLVENSNPEDYPSVDLRVERIMVKDVTLRPAFTITGRIVDESGTAVPGAAVAAAGSGAPLAYALSANAALQTRSLADGRYTIRIPWLDSSEPLRVWAWKKGYAPSRSDRITSSPDRRATAANVTLKRGERVTGRVTDADDNPVAGAVIASSRQGEGEGFQPRPQDLLRGEGSMVWPRTNAAGEFEFQAESGEYSLAAWSPGFQIATLDDVTVARDMKPLAFRLARGATIRGRVVRAGGAGVSGVSIAVAEPRAARTDQPIVTDGNGAFVIEDLSPGTWRLAFYKHEELIMENASATAPTDDFVLELPPAASLRGRVVDAASGAPVPRFQLQLMTSGGQGRRDARATMREFHDPDGAFTFENVPLGTYELTAGAAEYVGADPVEVVIAATGSEELRIALQRGVTITGRVTDDAGRPVPGANVGVDSAAEAERSARLRNPTNGVTDENGEYQLAGLSPGKVVIVAQKPSWVPARKEADISATSRVDLTLSRGITLTGVVIANGRPVSGAEVNAYSPVLNTEAQSTTSGASGEFTLSGLLPYRYTVLAMKEDAGRAELKDLDVRSAGRLTIELKAPQTATIYGRVIGVSPAADGRTYIRMVSAYSDSGSAQAAIDAAGNYRIEDAPTGDVRITAHVQSDAMSRSSMERVVEIAPGAEVQIDLEFPRAIVIRGRVTRDGVPFPRAYVSFAQEGITSGSGSAVSDDAGEYEIALERGGPWRIMVHAPDLRVPWRSLRQIDSSQTIDIDVRDFAIEGRVLDASSGAPIRDASVLLVDQASDAMPLAQVQTGARGDFALSLGAAGAYTLVVEKRGWGQVSRDVALDRSMTGLTIELSPIDGTAIRLVDARNGAPLSGVLLVRDSDGRVAASRYQAPRADGAIPLSLAPGRYDVTALVYGFASRRIQLTAPSPTVDVPLTPGGSLRIDSARELRALARLVGSDGTPYVGCCDGSPVFGLEGRVTRLPNVLPGAWRLEILGENGSVTASHPVTIAEGAEARITIE